jgi:hypothetical protein
MLASPSTRRPTASVSLRPRAQVMSDRPVAAPKARQVVRRNADFFRDAAQGQLV